MFAVSMPNSATAAALLEAATKCLATAPASPNAWTHQARAVRAFTSVSSVPKLFEQTMKSVSAGSRSRVLSTKSVASTLETKRKVRARSA